ncbi:MAG TPA: hypothetical protein PLT80_03905 [Candidatus Syntrophosphaera thermopropionivorans]|nr:hypothetical protein [Candidatus Syntrophosphaera thermopropionivorans]
MIKAVIDLGTNSIKCIIAEIDNNSISILKQVTFITKLGRNLQKNDELGLEVQEDAIEALKSIQQLCNTLKVEQVICTGTEALRKAKDSASFLKKIKQQFGWEVYVLSPEMEAKLIFLASSNLIPANQKGMIVESGGGSTEFIFGYRERFISYQFFPFGALTLTNKFIHNDPVAPEEFNTLKTFLKQKLKKTFPQPESIFSVASGGGATTLASVSRQLEHFEEETIHNFFLSSDEIDRQVELYKSLNNEQRRKIKGMQAGREDIILSSAVIYQQIAYHFNLPGFIISSRGIRYALLQYDLKV